MKSVVIKGVAVTVGDIVTWAERNGNRVAKKVKSVGKHFDSYTNETFSCVGVEHYGWGEILILEPDIVAINGSEV